MKRLNQSISEYEQDVVKVAHHALQLHQMLLSCLPARSCKVEVHQALRYMVHEPALNLRIVYDAVES